MSVAGLGPFRDPFREFGRLLPMAASGTRAPLLMAMDVCHGKTPATCQAGLHGAGPDSVEVTVEHGVLTIQGERTPHYGDSEQVIATERPQESFARQLSPGEGAGPREPHRRLRRRCPARDHPRLTEGPGPPG